MTHTVCLPVFGFLMKPPRKGPFSNEIYHFAPKFLQKIGFTSFFREKRSEHLRENQKFVKNKFFGNEKFNNLFATKKWKFSQIFSYSMKKKKISRKTNWKISWKFWYSSLEPVYTVKLSFYMIVEDYFEKIALKWIHWSLEWGISRPFFAKKNKKKCENSKIFRIKMSSKAQVYLSVGLYENNVLVHKIWFLLKEEEAQQNFECRLWPRKSQKYHESKHLKKSLNIPKILKSCLIWNI